MNILALMTIWAWLGGPLLEEYHTIGAYVTLAVTAEKREMRDLLHLAWAESRWRHMAKSSKGACGLWQIRPSVWGGKCWEYQIKPLKSALTARMIVRKMKRLCGPCWRTCYQYGPYHRVSQGCVRKAQGPRWAKKGSSRPRNPSQRRRQG